MTRPIRVEGCPLHMASVVNGRDDERVRFSLSAGSRLACNCLEVEGCRAEPISPIE